MASTRFFDDDARVAKKLQQQTEQCNWYLNVPSCGSAPPYMEDPQIITQKWAGNLWTNCTDIQSALRGLNVNLNRHCINQTPYVKDKMFLFGAKQNEYGTCRKLTTEQSRAIMPPWMSRDLQQNMGSYLPKNPQAHVIIPFAHDVGTRMYEKDNYKRDGSCFVRM